ncbi:interferon-induced protein 44-like isoform X1 [Lates calcarifer]|uniref:Interferon-induced protein 44-like n=1 Tax=Lates calcarifer TaxID=8187 RepID=A0AAJ8B2R6_LATCA|nr:interferon-induced protein 44-like [Lates calcarifer]XP_050924861.1 interferon-induced protein 44-like isoform X1 [Lates calcarifer]
MAERRRRRKSWWWPFIESEPEPEPTPSPTFKEPWRKISWGEKQRDLQYVQEYRPENGDIKHLRILLYGPVGGGKSSFINSVSTVMRGRTTIPAAASATTSDTSFTRQEFLRWRSSPTSTQPVVKSKRI